MRRQLLYGIGAVLLLAQIASMIYARFTDTRYFCWAPYDAISEYRIDVQLDDRSLTPDEVRARYHVAHEGIDPRSIGHVKDFIRRREANPNETSATVTLQYRINGGEEQLWTWPQPSS